MIMHEDYGTRGILNGVFQNKTDIDGRKIIASTTNQLFILQLAGRIQIEYPKFFVLQILHGKSKIIIHTPTAIEQRLRLGLGFTPTATKLQGCGPSPRQCLYRHTVP